MTIDPKTSQVQIEDNKIIQKFLKKHSKFETKIIKEIEDNIFTMINEKEYKIKIVKDCKYLNKIVWEYKIHLNDSLTFRVAYIIQENKVIVFFLSTTLIKANFTQEVHRYLQ